MSACHSAPPKGPTKKSVKHNMRDNNPGRYHQALSVILLASLLWGCGGSPEKPEDPTTSVSEEQQPAPIQQDPLILPPSQYSAQFGSTEQFLASFDWMQASSALETLPGDLLTTDDLTYRSYLQARIAYIRGDQSAAMQQLDDLDKPDSHPALRYRVLSFKHHILELEGSYIDAAYQANQILPLVTDNNAAWKRKLWLNLQRAEETPLQAALTNAAELQWDAWLELALISRSNNLAMTTELDQWRDNNPDHPAANPLPGGLSYLQQATPSPGNAALMLPLSGRLAPAGKAVLDGYLAAYYNARSTGRASYELLVLDMNEHTSANSAYEKAINLGATIVVGPLRKQGVVDLATRLDRPVPILALNRVDQVLPASGSALVQMSLAPEDEAQRIAGVAFGQGARCALIISPQDEWGAKVSAALREQWGRLGGTVAATTSYTPDVEYSDSLKSALGLDASEQRARNVRDMLATNTEFTPRRREDPDVIFLLSQNGQQARLIKPLLAFHYAQELPVYSISSIYNGLPDNRNRDLNGIRLVETPWLLGANPNLRVAIAAGDTDSGNYTRLNALGADAFLLQSEFSRLQSGADALLRGNTGLLSMDPQLRIHRELSPAIFDGGVLQPQ